MEIDRKKNNKKPSKIHQIVKHEPLVIKKVEPENKDTITQQQVNTNPHVIKQQEPKPLYGGVKQQPVKNPYIKPEPPKVDDLLEAQKKRIVGQIQPPKPVKEVDINKVVQVKNKYYNKITPPNYYNPLDERHLTPMLNIIIRCSGDKNSFLKLINSIKIQKYGQYKIWVLLDDRDGNNLDYVNEAHINLIKISADYHNLLCNDYEIGLFKSENTSALFIDDIMLRITDGWVIIMEETDRFLNSEVLNLIVSNISEDIDVILLKDELLEDNINTTSDKKVISHNFVCRHTINF